MLTDHLPAIGLYGSIEVALMVLINYLVAPEALKGRARTGFINNVTSLPLAVFLAGSAALGVAHTYGSAQERWFGSSQTTFFFLELYVAHNIVSLVIELSGATSFSAVVPMVAHHVLSIAAYSGGLLTHRMHFYACLDGMCETTNLFLNPFLLSRTEAGVGERVASTFGSMLLVNNCLLWLSFLIFRLCLFPTWLALFAVDVRAMFVDRSVSVAGQEALTWFELLFYPAVTLFLLVLSTIWFVKLTKGALKSLKEMRKAKGS